MKKQLSGISFLIIFIALQLISSGLHGGSITDSLERILTTLNREDTNKVNLLHDLAREYEPVDLKKAHGYLDQALQVSQRIGFKKGIAVSTFGIAEMYTIENNYPAAISGFFKALKMFEALKMLSTRANVYRGIGEAYEQMSSYDSSLKYYTLASHLFEKYRNQKSLANSYYDIGTIYLDRSQYEDANKLYFKGLKLYESIHDQEGISGGYCNVGAVFLLLNKYDDALVYFLKSLAIEKELGAINTSTLTNISAVYQKQHKFKEAITYDLQAMQMLKNGTDMFALASTVSDVADDYRSIKNYPIAKKYYDTAFTEAEKLENKELEGSILLSLGDISRMQKSSMEGINYLKKAESFLSSIKAIDKLSQAYLSESAIYDDMRDYKNAYSARIIADSLKDSVFNLTMMKQVAELKTKYETDKKETSINILKHKAEIDSLKIKKQQLTLQRNLYIIVGSMMLLLLLVISAFQFLRKQKLEQNITEQQNLYKQEQIRMNTILETEEKERLRIARDIHDDLGSGLSKIRILAESTRMKTNGNKEVLPAVESIVEISTNLVDNMKDLVWMLNSENTTLNTLTASIREYASDYLDEMPVELKMNIGQLPSDINISKEAYRNILFIAKECLQNIVKYANATLINIDLIILNDILTFKISDNGIGFDIDNQTTGNGIKNIRSRGLAIGSEVMIASAKNKGTKVWLSVTLKQIEKT